MAIKKREFSAIDANPAVLYAKINVDSTDAYPLAADTFGTLKVVPTPEKRYTTVTSGSVTVGTASTTVLGLNLTRRKFIIVNDGSSSVYISYAVAGASVGKGIRINASGGSLVEDMFGGSVYAICSTGTVSLTVTEL